MAFAPAVRNATEIEPQDRSFAQPPTLWRRGLSFALANKAWWIVPTASVWSLFGLVLLLG